MPIPGNERRGRFRRCRTVGLLCAAVGLALCAPAQSPAPTLASGSPALTDLVLRLGLGARLLGVTRWCQLPPGESRPLIGDALSLDFETIARLQPDWLVTQNSDPEQARALAAISPRTRPAVFTIESLADIAAAARRLARILDAPAAGEAAAARYEAELAALKATPRSAPPRILFLLGTDRPLVAGPETF
ncbi:MAG: ABC transporter substrate-binding protein, partial [Candidatus Marinimicrobia bacterium]|nr:ABC transporter substrate-binding protein [Candidatus Neomarinimicrobiota bacterium]